MYIMFKPNFDFVDEMRWRGLLHDIMPGTQELLNSQQVKGYVGFDPTADSLHIGNLVPITQLVHFQRAGHTPIVLLGGATGMVGDPSGKSDERKLLDLDTIEHNIQCQKKQLMKFISFEGGGNGGQIVNNYAWFKNWSLLDFIRDVGKHITVSYMMGKDSVRNRLETGGLSFTEFTYQLIQGYDFLHLYNNEGCQLQMGGSDQWGNITTGTELIRKIAGGEGFALTAPLITKADGSKFGKSEGANIWLDPNKTSPYTFYQFWLNVSDEDAVKFIKIYSLKTHGEIDALITENTGQEHLRIVQKSLAAELTSRVHSEKDTLMAIKATHIFFENGSAQDLQSLDEQTLSAAAQGMERYEIPLQQLKLGISVLDLLAGITQIFSSKSEARKMISAGGFSINKEKYTLSEGRIDASFLLHNKYLVAQKGKKQYFVLVAISQ